MIWISGALAVVALLATLLPAIPLPHGVFRVGEFPRVQILATALLAASIALVDLALDGGASGWAWTAIAACVAVVLVQLWFIRPFTPFSRRRVRDFDPSAHPADTPRISLLAANVKLSNRDYDRTLAMVLACDPDIAVFMEVDAAWIEALQSVTAHYPFQLSEPQDNGYGMFMVCRVAVDEGRIRHLLNDEVPSFHCRMQASNGGDPFRLVALHPEPPTIHQDTIGRDAEIGQVGLMMRDEDGPAIVFGDMNDVAWSTTTGRFLRISGMFDPRHGRGQFNSFDARYPFLRWPLDHIFVTPHFEIVALQRMPHVGSDHFAMYYDLALTQREAPSVSNDDASHEDLEDVRELVDQERARERRPIGVDWEG